MKKIISLLLTVIMLCLMAISAGVAEETYSYTVDYVTLELQTRVEDYIDGDVFRYSDLAKDLGWYVTNSDLEDDPEFFTRAYVNPDNPSIAGVFYFDEIGRIFPCINYSTMTIEENPGMSFQKYYSAEGGASVRIKFTEAEEDYPGPYCMNEKYGSYKILFSQIVITAYILEKARSDLYADMFEDKYPDDGNYYYVHE